MVHRAERAVLVDWLTCGGIDVPCYTVLSHICTRHTLRIVIFFDSSLPQTVVHAEKTIAIRHITTGNGITPLVLTEIYGQTAIV